MDWFEESWGSMYKCFISLARINVNCDKRAGIFFYIFAGFPMWSQLYDHLDGDYMKIDNECKEDIESSYKENATFDSFYDCFTNLLEDSEEFSKFNTKYINMLKDEDEQDKTNAFPKEGVEKDIVEYLKMFKDEEFKVRKNIIPLLAIYMCRYHISMNKETHDTKDTWLTKSVAHLQMFEETERTINQYFLTREDINMRILKFVGSCIYHSILENLGK